MKKTWLEQLFDKTWLGQTWEEEFRESQALALKDWETEKNELCFMQGDIYVRRKKYYALTLGYYVQSLEIFSELVPIVLDIMEFLLKDCFVFTHMYYEYPEHTKNRDNKNGLVKLTFGKHYTSFLKAHNWQGGEYFYDKLDDTLITFTKGADIPTLKTFYDVFNGSSVMHGLVYGFLKNPRDLIGDNYASVADFLSKDNHDILMLYSDCHIGLHIVLNSDHFDENKMITDITEICKKHGKYFP